MPEKRVSQTVAIRSSRFWQANDHEVAPPVAKAAATEQKGSSDTPKAQLTPRSLARSVSSPDIASRRQSRPKLAGVFDQLVLNSKELHYREKQLQNGGADESSHFKNRLVSVLGNDSERGEGTDSAHPHPPELMRIRSEHTIGSASGGRRPTPRVPRRRGYTVSDRGSTSRPLSPVGRAPVTFDEHVGRERAATVSSGQHRRIFSANAPTCTFSCWAALCFEDLKFVH